LSGFDSVEYFVYSFIDETFESLLNAELFSLLILIEIFENCCPYETTWW